MSDEARDAAADALVRAAREVIDVLENAGELGQAEERLLRDLLAAVAEWEALDYPEGGSGS